MDWSQLPSDLVEMISKKLPTVTDYVRFRAVCWPWRSAAAAKPRHLPPQLPWLMLPCNYCNSDTRDFCLLPSRRLVSLDLPQARGMRCCGCSPGWLVMVGRNPAITLLNPLTRDEIELPPLTSFPEVSEFDISRVGREYVVREDGPGTRPGTRTLSSDQMRDGFLYKIVLSTSPTSTAGCVVIALRCYYPWTLAFCRVGDDTWTVIETNQSHVFVDAMFFKGKVYAIDANGVLAVWDDSSLENLCLVPVLESPVGPFFCLLELSGDLLVVDTAAASGSNDNFKFFRLDLSGQPKGSQVKSIGDNITLFYNQNNCLFIFDGELDGCRKNCIYAVEEYYFDDSALLPFSKREVGKSRVRDIRRTDMANGHVELLPFYWEGLLEAYTTPIWFAPSLC